MDSTVDFRAFNAARAGWLLAQTFWFGGLWLLRFVLLPALQQIGLAPLLVQSVADALSPMLVGFAGVCALLQGVVLVAERGVSSLWRDLRGQLLLTVLAFVLSYLSVSRMAPDAQRWLLFNYLVLALCGVLLVLQPVPGRDGRN
jgi:cell division protein FtsW (lipid II flippase)